MTDPIDIVERLSGMSADHGPDGWPAVQMRDISALCDEVRRLRAALAAQVPQPGISAREVAREVFGLCELFEDQPDGVADSQEVKRFKAGQRFAAKRIRNAIGDWLTSAEAAAPGASPPPAALAVPDGWTPHQVAEQIEAFERAGWHGSRGYHAGLLKAALLVRSLPASPQESATTRGRG